MILHQPETKVPISDSWAWTMIEKSKLHKPCLDASPKPPMKQNLVLTKKLTISSKCQRCVLDQCSIALEEQPRSTQPEPSIAEGPAPPSVRLYLEPLNAHGSYQARMAYRWKYVYESWTWNLCHISLKDKTCTYVFLFFQLQLCTEGLSPGPVVAKWREQSKQLFTQEENCIA